MGLEMSKPFKREYKIIMDSFGSSGKSTLVYWFKHGHFAQMFTSIGVTVEQIECNGAMLIIYVLGANAKSVVVKGNHSAYDAIIYVMDNEDRARTDQCRQHLMRVLAHNHLRDAFLLVLANKQDLPDAMSVTEVADQLELRSLANRKWHVQDTSARTGQGIREAMDWLTEQLTSKS